MVQQSKHHLRWRVQVTAVSWSSLMHQAWDQALLRLRVQHHSLSQALLHQYTAPTSNSLLLHLFKISSQSPAHRHNYCSLCSRRTHHQKPAPLQLALLPLYLLHF